MLKLLHSLGMPDWLVRCASGDITPPEFTFDFPCRLDYGFPPAVLPIWSESAGPSYIGVLHHWFGDRKTTFVEYHLETKRFTEFARTPDQLRFRIVFDLLCNVPDSEEVAEFADALGLCPLDEFEDFFAEFEDEEEIVHHPVFQDSLPLGLATKNSEYTGDFPLRNADLKRYCDFEVGRKVIAKAKDVPPWFGDVEKSKLFDSLLLSKDYQGAWFCLNSSGWKSADMKRAIQQLASAVDINGLSLLSNWLIENIPDESVY